MLDIKLHVPCYRNGRRNYNSKVWMICFGISGRYFNEFLSKRFTNSVFYSPYIPIKLNTKSFSTTFSKRTIYTMAYTTLSSHIETRTSVDYSLCFSGVVKLCKYPSLQNMFFRIPIKIFSLILLMNIRYLVFVICNIGPSCLLSCDVTLL